MQMCPSQVSTETKPFKASVLRSYPRKSTNSNTSAQTKAQETDQQKASKEQPMQIPPSASQKHTSRMIQPLNLEMKAVFTKKDRIKTAVNSH